MPASAVPRDPAGTGDVVDHEERLVVPTALAQALEAANPQREAAPRGMTSSPGMWPWSMVSTRAMRASASVGM